MPGIYGYIKKDKSDNKIANMTKTLYYQDNFMQDDIFLDDYIECSHIHTGSTKRDDKYFLKNGIYVSIEGEQYDFKDKSFEEFMHEAYINNTLEEKLNRLDGYFHAVVYDSNIKKLFLISDRYGMRMLYYYHKDNNFAFSGEVKGLLELDFVEKQVSQKSFDCFMDLGYLLEDNTWFENIKLIKPATIMEFDLTTKKLSQKYYWSWAEIKPQDVSFEQAVDIVGDFFIKAVEKRFNPNEKIGVALSGGLDSRVIFAATDHLYPDYKGFAYTFGVDGCDDIEIAKIVTSRADWEHKVFHFTSNNWFEPRKYRNYIVDGMLNIIHMHGSEFLTEIKEKVDFNLNGYAGDVVLGGGWFNTIPTNTMASNSNLKVFYKDFTNLCNIKCDFYNIDRCEPHLYMNRVRRFTNMGTVNVLTDIDQRKPFFDNKLLEFIYSIPDDYRKDNKLYSTMLLKFFPKFFKDIPWQQTRRNLDGTNSPYLKNENIIRGYMNYAGAIREKSILDEIFKILNYESSIYKNFTDIDAIKTYLQPHLDSIQVNHIEKIFRYITAELYIRDVY